MARRVRVQQRDGVAIVTLPSDGASGAGLDAELRAGLGAALSAVQGPDLRAIVLRASEGGWPVAADPVTEYARDQAPALGDLSARIAGAGVPVIAVLSGTVSGGALALAQAATLRLALPKAQFEVSELVVGLLPGAGGLVRLARRAGAAACFAALASGQARDAETAMREGLCDALASDAAAEAAALATALRRRPAEEAAIGTRPDRSPAEELDTIAQIRADLPQGIMRPVLARAADVIEAAVLLPLDEALTFEAVVLDDLLASDLTAGLGYHRQILRRAMQAGAPMSVPGRIALWNQPAELALGLLAQRAEVQAGASDPAALEALVRDVACAQEAAQRAGLLTPAAREAQWDRLVPLTALTALAPCDALVAQPLPAEVADLPAAGQVALRIVGAGLPGAATFRRYPGLIEMQASEGDLATVTAILRAGGEALVVAEALGQQFQAVFLAAAERAVLAGATPAGVDRALCDWGFAEGVFARLDREGVAHGLSLLDAAGLRAGPYLTWLALDGRMGRAAGRGVWDYDALGRAVVPGDAAELLAALRAEAGVTASACGPREIVARIWGELAAAAAAALQAGQVHRAGDADLLALAAIGFPHHRGGPLFQADRAGLLATRNRLRRLNAEGAPAPVTLWDVLIRNGRRFGDLDG